MSINYPQGISVVIRTFNSGKTLGQLLSSLHRLPKDEIIVVDSGSSDDTLTIAVKEKAQVLRVEPPFNYSKSLNRGFRAAQNSWVLVISSHCIPQASDFMEILRRESALLPANVVVAYAPSTITGMSDPKLDSEQTMFFERSDYPRVSGVCGNGNTLYRRSAWEELPFDETVRTAEDKLWIIEMLHLGYGFAYIPTARGLNKNQASLIYMFRKGYRDARALREPNHTPMKLWQLAGALKNVAIPKFLGQTSWGNWTRSSAHILGQFFASYRSENNTPINGAS